MCCMLCCREISYMCITHIINCLQQCSIIKHKILNGKPFTNFSILLHSSTTLPEISNRYGQQLWRIYRIFFYAFLCIRSTRFKKIGSKAQEFLGHIYSQLPPLLPWSQFRCRPDTICSSLCSEETAKILCQVSAEGRWTNQSNYKPSPQPCASTCPCTYDYRSKA